MRKKETPLATENDQLREKVRELERDVKQRRKIMYAQGELIKNHQFDILRIFVETIEEKDHYTRGHSEAVTLYSVAIAMALDLPESQRRLIHKIGALHDMGKILVWDKDDFSKKSTTEEDRKKFREHPVVGADYLERLERHNPEYRQIIPGVRYHHERFDGISILTHPDVKYPGYPGELSGKGIPLESRIVAAADVFDAMARDRTYKKKTPVEIVLEELKRCSNLPYDKKLVPGKSSEGQLDPEVVDAFLSIKTIGSKKSSIVHQVGCRYVLRINPFELVINPKGYAPCQVCTNAR